MRRKSNQIKFKMGEEGEEALPTGILSAGAHDIEKTEGEKNLLKEQILFL